jgi:hypothetical protein
VHWRFGANIFTQYILSYVAWDGHHSGIKADRVNRQPVIDIAAVLQW